MQLLGGSQGGVDTAAIVRFLGAQASSSQQQPASVQRHPSGVHHAAQMDVGEEQNKKTKGVLDDIQPVDVLRPLPDARSEPVLAALGAFLWQFTHSTGFHTQICDWDAPEVRSLDWDSPDAHVLALLTSGCYALSRALFWLQNVRRVEVHLLRDIVRDAHWTLLLCKAARALARYLVPWTPTHHKQLDTLVAELERLVCLHTPLQAASPTEWMPASGQPALSSDALLLQMVRDATRCPTLSADRLQALKKEAWPAPLDPLLKRHHARLVWARLLAATHMLAMGAGTPLASSSTPPPLPTAFLQTLRLYCTQWLRGFATTGCACSS